eukprot:COSAG04_NODE_2213_length_4521_cov_2.365672_2_plen_347_part_00
MVRPRNHRLELVVSIRPAALLSPAPRHSAAQAAIVTHDHRFSGARTRPVLVALLAAKRLCLVLSLFDQLLIEGQLVKVGIEQRTRIQIRTGLQVVIYSASGGASFGETTETRSNGAAMTMSFHAQGGDTSVWLQPGANLDNIQREWAASFEDSNLYPWGVELRPIWELVGKVDQAKGDALQAYLTDKWESEAGEFSPTHFFEPAPGSMIMRSNYNGALVEAVVYTGGSMPLSWGLQHSLCAAAGRATPGSDLSWYGNSASSRHPEWLDKNCAYSADDNHVVADGCRWSGQAFTHVSGTLGGGVGYMCASSTYGDCDFQVRVEGTAAAEHGRGQVTLNSGDAVFCSP